jgi:alginate biosynthesis protein Alg44
MTRQEPNVNDLEHFDVVHEAEAQRQYPRVRVPGWLLVRQDRPDARDRKEKEKARGYRLHDLSIGGLSFEGDAAKYPVGSKFDGRLELTVEPVTFALDVHCEVRNVSRDGRRVGCCFLDLDPGEISALRRIIHGTLAGELVVAGDVLTALSRDNFVKARPAETGASLTGRARTRASLMTALMFAVGLVAFAYALEKFYEMAFVTKAAAAKIAAPTFTIAMPRDGTFFSLVPENGIVKKGQPVASFQAAMLDVIQADVGNLKLSPAELSQLMGETLKGTLSSPCDCKVQHHAAIDGQYVNRGQPLFELVPETAEPYVLARFHFDNIDDLPIGRRVKFRIYGESGDHAGEVRDVRLLPSSSAAGEPGASDVRGLNNAGTVSDVIATIEPAEPLDRQLIDRPVEVTLGGGTTLAGMLFKPVKEE